MILLIDNYDSFSYNLYQLVGQFDAEIRVVRNDEITVDEIREMKPSHMILSPGPGRPEKAGICVDAVKTFSGKIPILGVCLGHQAICAAYGAKVSYAKTLMHGKSSEIRVVSHSKMFDGVGDHMTAARYHSLSAVKNTLPECLRVTAMSDDDEVMAVEHTEFPVYGLQFHPESILTPDGPTIIRNFLNIRY
ncbi:MAG: aminodeoxychorismate/anthranilate synthase component II [Lachnospiraceae bacterium]|nr:aminodeoxychorismate/anthranilate synthase component II [Lachnospiraceae bacterium]